MGELRWLGVGGRGGGRGRVACVVCGLVWGIGLRRLGCVCGRRLGTGKRVSVRQTTTLVVLGLGRAFLCLSVCLSVARAPRAQRVAQFLAQFHPPATMPTNLVSPYLCIV